MRLKDYNEKEGKRVWLSEKEMQSLIDEAQTPQQKLAFILGGRCGLRRQEMIDVKPRDILENETGHIIRVWHGKDDKYREVPAPDELVNIVDTLSFDMEPDEIVLGTEHGATVWRWVQRAAERRLAETNDKGWSFVDVHDLRRSWGVRLLESGVLPSVVMDWGGWEDWETFRKHYLAEFSPEALRRERGKVGWLGGKESAEISYTAFANTATRSSRGQPRG